MKNDAVKTRFVIWATSFDEQSGGSIALHHLCDSLNRLGIDASIWPATKPARGGNILTYLYRLHRYLRSGRRCFGFGPFPRRLARSKDLKDAVVVYPEIVAGNPLGASRVVRWLLHKPGFHTGVVDYGRGELYLAYNEVFAEDFAPARPLDTLTITYFNPVYRQTNFGDREGSCYLVRKGRGTLDRHPTDAMPVEDMTHAQKADAFNRYERFYTYDTHTFYTTCAAICGCIPIIIPAADIGLHKWIETNRTPGIAYGEDDIDWVVTTRGELLARLDELKTRDEASIRNFVRLCDAFFRREDRAN